MELSGHTRIPVLQQRFGTPGGDAGGVLRRASPAAGEGHAPTSPATSLYIHVPFCFHKCHYCDFYSIVDTQDRQAPFVDRLTRELAALAPFAGPLGTIFIGGGTPTLLRPDLWVKLLGAIRSTFALTPHLEFTVECNPETATPELFAILADGGSSGGVNRVSIGAQSFESRHLKTLERWHDPEKVFRAIELAREAGIPRQSLDLIWGVPGQTLPEWEHDLTTALSAATTHLSCYSLTYEPGTAMTARLSRGEFARTDEDLDADMFIRTLEMLRAAGLERYEVSNFAKPGDECRHNLAYWRQHNWLAAGPSASGHMNGYRWKNLPRLDDYLNSDTSGFAPVMDVEDADPRRNLRERIMTGLRTAEGLDTARTLRDAAHISPTTPDALTRAAARQIAQGNLTDTANRWRLTDDGFLIADTIAAELMRSI
ncbi:MAG TPA: radical SAM family heme chaperone HemW [Phycisphaerales bacterium]|nr:radical SAM family heme chaperone HemW [Phycisphaerales bacterium]